MHHRHHGCGPRGHFEINLPEALMAMRGGRGWQGNWGPFHFDFGDEGWGGGRRGRRARRMFEGGELQARPAEADRRRAAPRLRPHPRDRGADRRRICAEPGRGLSDPDPAPGHGPDRGSAGRRAAQAVPGRPTRAASISKSARRRSRRCSSGCATSSRASPSMAGPAIGRAVRNLMTALSHRVGRDGLDDDLLHEIAAILDEAAQRIERVK